MPKHYPFPGLTIYGDERHFSGSFEDAGKHAGHALDACPFCGSNRLELRNTHTPSYWVSCLKCHAEAHGGIPAGGGGAILDERRALIIHLRAMRMAVRKWNKRIVDKRIEHLDWLERNATVNFDYETASISFRIPEDFKGSNSLQELIDHARRIEEKQS